MMVKRYFAINYVGMFSISNVDFLKSIIYNNLSYIFFEVYEVLWN